MNHAEIAAKTAAYLETFVGKEGFCLLKTEYVKEDGIFYLRAYIDLTEEERESRKKTMEEEKTGQEETGVPEKGPENVPERTEDGTARDEDAAEETANEPGIGVNDCALVSRRLSKWLDKEDFIPEEYMLEVCSKGYLN